MSISKTKTYLVLNYSSSPVAVKTKYESLLVPAGTRSEPGALPFGIDDIQTINSNSPTFKIGLLWFEEEYASDIYEELRIIDWKDILTDEQIENIILNPTMESLQRILNIENEAYFERVRGVYMGLKNAGYDISNRVEKVIEPRRLEFVKKQRKSQIKLVPSQTQNNEAVPTQEEFNSLKDQLAAMQSMIEKLTSTTEAAVKVDEDNGSVSEVATETETKPTTRRTTKSTVKK